MKSLKGRIKRLEAAKKASTRKQFIVVSTEHGREHYDLKKAKEKYGEKPDLIYVVTYVPEPDPLPEYFKKSGGDGSETRHRFLNT